MSETHEETRLKDAFARKTMREGLEEQFTQVEIGPWKHLEGAEPGYLYADFQGYRRDTGTPVRGGVGLTSDSGLCMMYTDAKRLEPLEAAAPAEAPARKPPGKVGFSFTV